MDKIRTGGFCENDDESAMIVGGSDGMDFVCDDISFQMNLRLIELARFEISQPDLNKCRRKFAEMFAKDISTRRDIYMRLMSESKLKPIIYDRFIGLIDSVAKLEDWVMMSAVRLGKQGRPINITIPPMAAPGDSDLMDPAVLCDETNKMLKYMRDISIAINGLSNRSPIDQVVFAPISSFEVAEPDMNESAPSADVAGFTTPEQYLATMRILLNFEFETAKYAQEVERYRCIIIGRMSQAQNVLVSNIKK